jgi:hypothetical protein
MFGEVVTGKKVSHPSGFERYTEPARRAVYFARLEALRRGDSAITVADLLAGLSVDEDTRAERIGSLKANAFYLRWLVGLPALPAQTEATPADTGIDLDTSRAELDPDSKRALAYAVVEADRDRSYWIDTDHLLRGLLRFPNKADFALLKTEVSLKAARRASRADREEFLPQESPNRRVMQYLIRKWAALLVPPVLGLACYLYILIEGFGLTASPLAR